MIRYLEIDEILELHFWIIEDFGGSHGVRDELGLKSLVTAPQTVVFGEEQYVSVHEKAAVYLRNCIADHIFTDGNKAYSGDDCWYLFGEKWLDNDRGSC